MGERDESHKSGLRDWGLSEDSDPGRGDIRISLDSRREWENLRSGNDERAPVALYRVGPFWK